MQVLHGWHLSISLRTTLRQQLYNTNCSHAMTSPIHQHFSIDSIQTDSNSTRLSPPTTKAILTLIQSSLYQQRQSSLQLNITSLIQWHQSLSLSPLRPFPTAPPRRWGCSQPSLPASCLYSRTAWSAQAQVLQSCRNVASRRSQRTMSSP